MLSFLTGILSSQYGKVFLIVFISLFTCLSIQSWIYNKAQTEAKEQYEKALNELRKTEREKLEKAASEQQKIVFEYTSRIEDLQKQHEETIKQIRESKFVDAIEVPSIHVNVCSDSGVQYKNGTGGNQVQKSGTGSDLVCYTRRELQSKIAESMAIAEECDKMTEKYRMLLKLCQGD